MPPDDDLTSDVDPVWRAFGNAWNSCRRDPDAFLAKLKDEFGDCTPVTAYGAAVAHVSRVVRAVQGRLPSGVVYSAEMAAPYLTPGDTEELEVALRHMGKVERAVPEAHTAAALLAEPAGYDDRRAAVTLLEAALPGVAAVALGRPLRPDDTLAPEERVERIARYHTDGNAAGLQGQCDEALRNFEQALSLCCAGEQWELVIRCGMFVARQELLVQAMEGAKRWDQSCAQGLREALVAHRELTEMYEAMSDDAKARVPPETLAQYHHIQSDLVRLAQLSAEHPSSSEEGPTGPASSGALDHHNLAVAAYEKGVPARALEEYEQALSLEPSPEESILIKSNYAQTIWAAGDFDNRGVTEISDSERRDVDKMLRLFRELVDTYESLGEDAVLASGLPLSECYRNAKINTKARMSYGFIHSTLKEQPAISRAGPAGPPSKSGCFIATAVYGTPLCQEVQLLSQFRDDVLLRCAVGRRIVRLYCLVSPHVAERIQERRLLRYLARVVVVAPALKLSAAFTKRTQR